MKAIIIEDEPQASHALELMLKEFCPEVEVVASTENGLDGLKKIKEFTPDLLFMDINLPVLSGFETLDLIEHENFHIIFVTASPAYVMKAIKFMPYDYLLKPVHPDELQAAVQKVFRRNKANDEIREEKTTASRILLPTSDGQILMLQDEILFITADGSYSELYFADGKSLLISSHLKVLEEGLNDKIFFRCHHSYIINLQRIKKFIRTGGTYVEMENGAKIEVARRRKKELQELLERC